jgi:hypothetical protein
MNNIEILQANILSSIDSWNNAVPESQPIPLLKKIQESASIEIAFGKYAEKIRAFINSIDLSHPHIREVYGYLFEESFCLNVVELLELADYAKQKGLTRVLPMVGNKVFNNSNIKELDSPINNRRNIRLLKTKEDRKLARSFKKAQNIDLCAIVKHGEDIWACQPSLFDYFIRYSTAYKDEIAFAKKKFTRYMDLGCSGLAKHIIDSVELLKKQINEAYYGFNRITMTNAAVILAKMHNYKLVTDWSCTERKYRISIPVEKLYRFELDQKSTSYEYEPRVYPVHLLKMPDSVAKIVDYLEAFPQAEGKAIFDQYVVIVPSPSIKSAGFIDPEGNKCIFNNKEEATKELDIILISGNYIQPILLGEKDGKCFFICFWK